jgi:CHAT domain-containing protein
LTKLIIESGNEKALAKYQRLLSNRSLLSKITNDEKHTKEMSLDSLKKETETLERELIKECKIFGDYTANLRTTWQDVQKALNPNDIAIEFLSFPLIDSSDSVLNKTLYTAITLRKNDKAPHFHVLFDDEELNKIGKNNLYGTALYDLIWGTLDNYLSGIDNVYFSPTGKLYNINIEALPEIVGRNIDKNYYRISSTRLLAQHNYHGRHANGIAIIYGGLKYDASISELISNSRLYKDDKSSYRGDLDSLDLRHGWKFLPGTLLEVNAINSSLIKNEMSTKVYTDTLGTEASFKSYNGQSSEIIHIATHGFYYTESDSIKMRRAHLDYLGNQMNKHARSYVEDYSLTRSGLLMAGCNNILRGEKLPDNIDDGVLFAKEIADINMKNVGLIVLSSCDSGLGDLTKEGVFGLQRAFKKAGAKSILMSLWKVDDNATRILMTQFYENYLSLNMSKNESLKAAQRYLRNYEDGVFKDPKYWAAFVMLDGI